MINSEEHKKLLTQIAELEKNSVDYFDVEKEFFLIDSNNLTNVKTRLYGYSIQATGIYEEDNLTEDAVKNLDGRGCYVYVEVKNEQISIKQDLNGCWGIYLFRHGDYFALSNSFFRLVDHVKLTYPLTVNRDYCNQLLLNDLCMHTYSETAVNEIQLVERNAILHIDIESKKIESELIDYRENTVSLESEEGISILDSWVEFWGSVLRGVAQNTKFLTADLTGGFDSRIAFVIALNSGIDLNKMQIFSIKGTLHTYKEDYEIASKIATHYNFELNQSLPASRFLHSSLSDAWNRHLYSLQTFHKSVLFSTQKPVNKCYSLTGYGGETIRTYWQKLPRKFVENQNYKVSPYSGFLSRELFRSLETITNSAFLAIREKYRIEDETCEDLPQYLYQETRCRHHFGKISLHAYFRNKILISPILDPSLRTLKLKTTECQDHKLLISLLFARYAPDLLKFPFDSKHSIKPTTIEYAQKINARFPRRILSDNANENSGGYFNLQPIDLQVEKILADGKNNPNIPSRLIPTCMKAIFKSRLTYGIFTSYFNAELYNYAENYYDTHEFNRYNYIIGVIGVAKVLENVEISQHNSSLYRDIQRFLEQGFCGKDDTAEMIRKFKNHITARLNVRLLPKEEGDFQIISVSDERADVAKPSWLNQSGTGICYGISSYIGKLEFVAKSTVDGKLILWLRGLWVENPKNKSERIPYWIDFTKLIVNDKLIFDTITPAWCDKPYVYKMDAKAGEEIKVQVEWLPHRSDT